MVSPKSAVETKATRTPSRFKSISRSIGCTHPFMKKRPLLLQFLLARVWPSALSTKFLSNSLRRPRRTSLNTIWLTPRQLTFAGLTIRTGQGRPTVPTRSTQCFKSAKGAELNRDKGPSIVVLALFAALVSGVPTMHAQEAANPTLQAKAKAAKATKATEEQEKADKIARKMKEPFWKRLDEAFLEQLGTPANTPPEP